MCVARLMTRRAVHARLYDKVERRQLLDLFKNIGGGPRVGPVSEALGFPEPKQGFQNQG